MRVNSKCIECAKDRDKTANSMACYKGKACLKKRSYYRQHDRYKVYMKTRLYGITPEQYYEMLSKQGNKCAICNEVMTMPCIDHDHKTGKVRGLLCSACNHALGFVREDIAYLSAMADYIRRYQ